MKTIASFALAALLATQTLAHSKVSDTTPADGAIVTQPPTSIDFTFSKAIRLTVVKLSPQKGSEIKLDLRAHTTFAQEFSLPVQRLDPGDYRVEWRGLGLDGHPMRGAFSFSVE